MAEGDTSYEKLKLKQKLEDDVWSEETHSHKFTLKFHASVDTFTIHCDQPQTVLEAINYKLDLQQKLRCDEQRLTLQISEAAQGTAIATHFPCSRLDDGELVTATRTTEPVEERGKHDHTVFHNERYYVVFIETKGGINAKTKPLFRSSAIKKFTRLCVYGTKDMTIRDAIARDGRFKELKDFKLEDVSKDKSYAFSNDKILAHENKTFRICFEKTKIKENIKLENQSPPQKAGETSRVQDASVRPKVSHTPEVIRISEVVKSREASEKDLQEIYQLLRQQFPALKQKILDRFPGNSLEETLEKVDFGKTQQSFSDVFRLEMLFKFGKSVCKLVVGEVCVGTAFVMFQHYILTNAHLFNKVVHDNTLDPGVNITALFDYKKADQQNTRRFAVHKLIDFDEVQDYAVLELVVTDQDKVPPGLMNRFIPIPESGEACIIGHPGGDVLQIDPTCVIEKRSRIKEVNDHLQRFKENEIAHMSVYHQIKKQGISRILSQSDPLSQSLSQSNPLSQSNSQSLFVASYHTFMFHGSSGSPVFDAQCRVFGLHSGGFTYGLRPKIESVIEFSHPVLLIFQKFVTNLKRRNQEDLLRLVEEHSSRNFHLKKILRKILGPENLSEEPMDMS